MTTRDPFRSNMPPPVSLAPPRCLYCAAIVREADACPRCRQPFRVTHDKRVGAPCPRCRSRTLEQTAVDDATVYLCGECHGCFIHAVDWDELIARCDEGSRVSLGEIVPPPPGHELTRGELFESAPCPVCSDAMQRYEFAGHHDLWLDACPRHGIWMDAGELVATVQLHKAHPDELEAPIRARSPDEDAAPGEYPRPPNPRAWYVMDLARAIVKELRVNVRL